MRHDYQTNNCGGLHRFRRRSHAVRWGMALVAALAGVGICLNLAGGAFL